MTYTEKMKKANKLYQKKLKQEFKESDYTNWNKFCNDKNDALYKKTMENYKLYETTETHKIFKCICGSKIKKAILGNGNGNLSSHLKSDKHKLYEQINKSTI